MDTKFGPILLKDEAATAAFAQSIAAISDVGDVILLVGDIGAGKSFFSRQFILSVLPFPEDVPSPTFTLVQTYNARNFEIWHCDLYRLNDLNDAIELGLDDAFEAAVCLIEWPDRLGSEAPKSAVTLSFSTVSQTTRQVTARFDNPKWAKLETIFDEYA